MLIEGSWWENESTVYGNFKKIENAGGQSYEEMELLNMPLPHAEESKIGMVRPVVDVLNTYMFVNADASNEKMQLISEFLKYMNTDEKLVQFTKETNTFRALNYELTNTQVEQLSS